jgi:ketosteroid isomerase-like protein
MSKEIELLKSAYGAYNNQPERDELFRLVGGFCAPDVEWWPAQEPAPGHGHEAVVKSIEGWYETWTDLEIAAEEFLPWDRGVVVRVSVAGRGRGSGIAINERFFHLFEIERGKVTRFREYRDREAALDAAGLQA